MKKLVIIGANDFQLPLILFSLGFIGEYIGRIYMTVSDLQQFAIREIINAEDEK